MPLTPEVTSASFPVWTTLGLGFVLGLRHALDPDHLAAVSTFASEEKNLWRSSLIGVFWGVGHSLAVIVFGLFLVAFRLAVTPGVTQFLEFLVGCMLITLGSNVMVRLLRGPRIHVHDHAHDGAAHLHLHAHGANSAHTHQHRHLLRLGGRPLLVGIVHGLAGTAAVMLLVVAAIPSSALAFAYLVIFGVGSIGGMMMMSLLMSLPLALAARRLQLVEKAVRLGAGMFSFGFGLYLMWETGFIQSCLR